MTERLEEYNGAVKGDQIRITGMRGAWTFDHVAISDDGKPAWITVIGPKGYRFFYPDKFNPPKKKRKRKEVL